MLKLYDRIKEQEDYLAEELYSFMLEHFDQQALYRKKLDSIDLEILKLEKEQKAAQEKNKGKRISGSRLLSAFDRGSSYLSSLVVKRLNLMDLLGYERTEILAYRNEYRALPEIRALEMREAEEQGSLPDLIALLKEGKDLDKDWHSLVSKYSWKLINCYEQSGNTEDALQEAKDYALQYAPGELNGFIRLKSFYGEPEWAAMREQLFANARSASDLNRLYREEGLYDRIVTSLEELVKKSGTHCHPALSEVSQYQDVLRPHYEKELLVLYEQIVRKMAYPASGRSGYQQIVSVLRKMLKFEGGQPLVRSLLEEWRIAYNNRPAMQDELRAVFSKP
jgi:hypothetical protein